MMKLELSGAQSVQNGWAVLSPPTQMGHDKKVECVCSCGARRVFYWLDWTHGRLPSCTCQMGASLNNQVPNKELEPISEEFNNDWRLVSNGFLPPANGFTKEGIPVWNLSGIALILGISRKDLLEAVRRTEISQTRMPKDVT